MEANEPRVTVTKRGADRIQAAHPWIYRSDVAQAQKGIASGSVVILEDQRRRFLGKAFWSEKSKITLRVVTREDEAIDDEFFASRIRSALSLRRLAFGDGEDAFRLVHGEADLLPGLVIDKWGETLVMQTLVPATDQRKERLAAIAAEIAGAGAVVERNDVKVRELEGLPQQKGMLRGEAPAPYEHREGEVRLSVDLLAGQKTGGFLDQRENHLRAGAYAHGDCLDAFSYQGGFALQLARNAKRVVAVEISETASAQIKENALRNRAENVEVVTANAFDFLKAQSDHEPAFDLVVLDPPAFAKNKDAIDAARRGYKEVNLRAFQVLRPGGILVTASCSYHVSEAMLEEIVLDAARDAGRPAQLLERRGAGRDHPVLLGVPETRYLKCFILRAP
jgi:23S rRNA (cytosine1962-C5)-methyltransferase